MSMPFRARASQYPVGMLPARYPAAIRIAVVSAAGSPQGDAVLPDPVVHDLPVEVVEERLDVGSPVGLVVEEVRVLVHVERDQRGGVPDGESVLGVADVVEQP